ncbi:MAG: hypothetical protein ACI9KE_006741, partial [Polyangiales bacterium]
TTGAGFSLSPALAGLEPVREYVSVVSGMRVRTGNERGHHAGCVGILSGAPMISQDPMGAGYASTFSAPTIDQIVKNHVATGTRYGSLEYGISESVVRGEGSTLAYLSHNGEDSFNEPEYSPRALFNRVFTDGFVNPGETPEPDPRLGLRRSVLDAVIEDANALHARVGVVDQRRLDQHLTSIRELERRIAVLETMPERPPLAACAIPTTPAEEYGRDEMIERNIAMAQVMAMALACDQTRVFSNMFSGSVGGQRFPGTSGGHHGLTHDEGGEQPMVQAITRYIIDRFGDMLEVLRDVEEGDGNLLDRCVILASSDLAEGRPHSLADYPILVAGGGGGALRAGVHYRSAEENTSKVLLSCLQAMGLPVSEFGVGGGYVDSACTEILVPGS